MTMAIVERVVRMPHMLARRLAPGSRISRPHVDHRLDHRVDMKQGAHLQDESLCRGRDAAPVIANMQRITRILLVLIVLVPLRWVIAKSFSRAGTPDDGGVDAIHRRKFRHQMARDMLPCRHHATAQPT